MSRSRSYGALGHKNLFLHGNKFPWSLLYVRLAVRTTFRFFEVTSTTIRKNDTILRQIKVNFQRVCICIYIYISLSFSSLSDHRSFYFARLVSSISNIISLNIAQTRSTEPKLLFL